MKEIRDMRETEAKEYCDRLRQVKQEHFAGKEKLQQVQRVAETKQKELKEVDQELKRVSNLLNQTKE